MQLVERRMASSSRMLHLIGPLESWSHGRRTRGSAVRVLPGARKYLDKNKDSAFGHFLLGYILFREIQESAGVKSGTSAAAYSEKVADGSDTGTREAKAKASLAEYTEGAKYHDPSALDLKIVALDYVLLGDYPHADPRDSKAHETLGKAYARLDQLPKAQTELEKALELSPQSTNLHCLLAPVYRKQGLTEKVKIEFDRCAAMHVTHSSPEPPRP